MAVFDKTTKVKTLTKDDAKWGRYSIQKISADDGFSPNVE
jgi:hypothetical protein